MTWFRRKDKNITDKGKKNIPSGLWIKCPTCSEIQYKPELDKNYSVCRHCGHHFRVSTKIYRDLLLDEGSFSELFKNIKPTDPLEFKAEKKYSDQLVTAQSKTKQNDAISCYNGKINNHDIILAIMNFSFIGGSMGSVVGELVSRAIESARDKQIPLILICASGGARMQESSLSLLQLAKTSSK